MKDVLNAAGRSSCGQGVSEQGSSGQIGAESHGARQQLERLYREIGISAVAAAVAQIRKPEPASDTVRRETPACLRDETSRAA